MAAYLIISVFTGLVAFFAGLIGFDTGFWTAALWYVVGCWAGFAVTLAIVIAAMQIRKPLDGASSSVLSEA